MADITIPYNIEKHIAVLSVKKNGWTKELNVISWNDKPAKYDIRDWSEDHEKMSKGITLSQEEMNNLLEAMGRK